MKRPKYQSKQKSVALAAVALCLIGVSFYLVWMFLPKSSDDSSLKAVQDKVGRHLLLPSDEVPALITVTDKSKVSSKFLESSENGDKVLVYEKYQRAIIYRPSADKIVDMRVISIGDPSKEAPRAAWPKNLP